MKKIMKIGVSVMIALALQSQVVFAQKIDEERMNRDIEVAENVLSTLIKQETNQQRGYYGLDVKGSYQEGYGITFRLPGDNSMVYIKGKSVFNGAMNINIDSSPVISYSYSRVDDEAREPKERIEVRESKGKPEKTEKAEAKTTEKTEKAEGKGSVKTTSSLKEAADEKRMIKMDSLRDEYNKKLIQASKDFIVDYGDLLSQLGANERIVVTNQGENRSWYFKQNKRSHISIEGNKADIVAFKQGKATREQTLAKLKVVNTETIEEKEQDMELLSSIFNRLYRPDLSTTYFAENNLYYERLKDYGVIFYLQVYSSYDTGYKRYALATQNMEDVDEVTRDKKVVELYPKFERELKENILEYGRTLKNLKDEEVLVFNVTLTKCKIKGCGIPTSLELTVKGSVLKDFGAGRIDKAAGLTKFTTKKGPNQ